MTSPLWPLLRSFSWQELRQHPWRNAAAVLAVALGVALALSVHLINASALDEFAQAARATGGQPDLELRSSSLDGAGVPEALYARLARHPEVAVASPILDMDTYALVDGAQGKLALKVLGVDPLSVAAIAPQWLPRPGLPNVPSGQNGADATSRTASFEPGLVFLNPSAQAAVGLESLRVQLGLQVRTLRVAGTVAHAGAPLAVMDIAAAQDLFNQGGRLSRVDVRLRQGVDRAQFAHSLLSSADWPAGTRLARPDESTDRLGAMSRAYRVNLTVLALVALFTGGFLVFSVLALSVSRRGPQWALLGVLGLTSVQRQKLVLLEAASLGLVGSALGLALGTGLAALALNFLGGDLGGGFFAGRAPTLQWSPWAAAAFGGLGVVAALLGAWQPARWARALSAAQALKGLGALGPQDQTAWLGLGLLLLGGLLALLPPVGGIPLAAYASVGLVLMGGIAALPWLVGQALDRVAPGLQHSALSMLAVERARRVRASASVAVSGVVAALSLAVALTVMVASFRGSVTQWLDQVLPADLYVRATGSAAAQNTGFFDAAFVSAAGQLPNVAKLGTQRSQTLVLQAKLPRVTLIARTLQDLPLVDAALPVPQGHIGVVVSEAMVDLHGARPGTTFPLLSQAFNAFGPVDSAGAASFFVAGVWRDYARQFGTIAIEASDFERLTSDRRVNDIALWLKNPEESASTEQALRDLADRLAATPAGDSGRLLEFASANSIRAISLRIFDRSFAVTYWLQAIAIGIGLFGVAASFSAQVLARRKEFGLLVHLGLTRGQVLRVVALEGFAWTALGAVAGVALGLAVSVVLVKVVNPQSFHWTMDLSLPVARLALLALSVVLAGTITAWLAARSAAGRDAVLSVKEDW